MTYDINILKVFCVQPMVMNDLNLRTRASQLHQWKGSNSSYGAAMSAESFF